MNLDMITLLKIIAIIYVSIINIVAGLSVSVILDKWFFPTDDITADNAKSTGYLVLEVSIIMGIIGITCYALRNFVQNIPFPFDNMYGFQYNKVKEVASGALITTFMVQFCSCLVNKITVLKNRLI